MGEGDRYVSRAVLLSGLARFVTGALRCLSIQGMVVDCGWWSGSIMFCAFFLRVPHAFRDPANFSLRSVEKIVVGGG